MISATFGLFLPFVLVVSFDSGLWSLVHWSNVIGGRMLDKGLDVWWGCTVLVGGGESGERFEDTHVRRLLLLFLASLPCTERSLARLGKVYLTGWVLVDG